MAMPSRCPFELMATGLHKKADVFKIITSGGLLTPRGKSLSPRTFTAVLKNTLYAGWITLPSDESFEPVCGQHEPIVSLGIFDRVQALLKQETKRSAKTQTQSLTSSEMLCEVPSLWHSAHRWVREGTE
jgi:Recombinase